MGTSQSSLTVYMADLNVFSSPSRQSYGQSHTYSPQGRHTPSFDQRYPHQVSNGLPQHLDTSIAPSWISSCKRPTPTQRTSYLDYLPTYPANRVCFDHSISQLNSGTVPPAATSPHVGCDYHPDQLQLLGLIPVEAYSHSKSLGNPPPFTHSQAQSISIAQFGHPHPCLQCSTNYSPDDISGGGMYAGQVQGQEFLGLNVNTVDISSSSQNGYVHSSTYHSQSRSAVPSSNSDLTSSSLSPLSPLTPHFSNSQSSPGSTTFAPILTSATYPRIGTVEAIPLSRPCLEYPASPTRPFVCGQCKLSFVRYYDLKRHKETHTGSRPHMCSICEKTYARKDALIRHQMVKHFSKEISKKKSSRKKDDD